MAEHLQREDDPKFERVRDVLGQEFEGEKWVDRDVLIFSQFYASHDYQALLAAHGCLCSMSRKGDCYDNAAMESFFHTLKVEQVNDAKYRTREEAKADVFEYIETYYNPIRRHSTLNYLSPRDFENRMVA